MRGAIPIVNLVHAILTSYNREKNGLKGRPLQSPDVEIVIEAMRDDCVDTSAYRHIVCG